MLTVFFVVFTNFLQKRWGDSRTASREVESQPHPNSLIYNDGAANSPPSPYASLAFRGRRWQAPIGSPSSLTGDCWVGLLLEAPRGAGRSVSSSGLLIHSTSKNWNTRLKKTHMIVDIIVAVNTCITSVMNTIFVDLSYLKGKNKE